MDQEISQGQTVGSSLDWAKARKVLALLRAYWRPVIALCLVGLAEFLVRPNDFFTWMLLPLLLIFIASQIFWIARIVDLGERLLPGKPRRAWLTLIACLLYLFVVIYCYQEWDLGHAIHASDYRLQSRVIAAVFWWWFVGSMSAFLLVMAFGTLDRAARAAAWLYGKTREAIRGRVAASQVGTLALDPPSPSRRRFLEQTAVLVSATPFVAAGYGLLYGRQNVEVVRQRIRLARLPEAFEGFRIALLSDIHIGPFTTADYIRRCVMLTNGLKPDLIALTGDYVCYDPVDQGEAVRALAGLRAPKGVFGCLGNHEWITGIEDSITRLFALQGIRILRQERAAISLGRETINLIGVDDYLKEGDISRHLQQVRGLVMPNTANILLIHYPQLFDHPELGVDLTLSGDLHGGGQMSLDFIHRGLNLGRMMGVPYVSGLYENHGAQLYSNRGLGITGYPIRVGARPEITVLELVRGA